MAIVTHACLGRPGVRSGRKIYSYLRTSMGSTFVARRKGTKLARRIAMIMAATAITQSSAEFAATPVSSPENSRATPQHYAGDNHLHASREHQPENVARVGAAGDAYSDLARAALHKIRHHAVDPHPGKEQCYQSEIEKELCANTEWRFPVADILFHRLGI